MSGGRAAVHVWVGRVPEVPSPADLPLLDAREARRVAAFQDPVAGARYAGARAAIRRTVAAWLGVAAGDVVFGNDPCPGCGDERHGPPRLLHPVTEWRVGVSRSASWWMLALSPGVPVGVDIEARGPHRVPAVVRRCLSPGERAHVGDAPEGTRRDDALTRCWVRKEAVGKGWGVGIGTDLAAVDVQPGHVRAVVVRRTPRGNEPWEVFDLAVGPACLAALALPSECGLPVSVHHAPGARPPQDGRADE
ncbi:4'-phosphopantetheinyl transferase family protein [Streptomyces sp. NPDC048496]|uniref:4'-phosphopantetheinyl transferase family protein n=1 Tax=Streptomyces sp. NPDC048496 TaxID=3365558 RepID=UPI00371C3837